MAGNVSIRIFPRILLWSILLAIASSMASAGIDFTYQCSDENCMEGTPIEYNVYLRNTANFTLTFDKLVLGNKDFNIIIDFDISPAVTLAPGESHFYNFSRLVKALPDNSYTLTVQPCFQEVKMAINENLSSVYTFCSEGTYNIPILPLAKINCNSSSDCGSDETCFFFRCKALSCGDGLVARNHECAEKPASPADGTTNQVPDEPEQGKSNNAIVVIIVVVLAVTLFALFMAQRQSKKPSVKSGSQLRGKKK
ncbi:hypothetical protein J4227_00845 [Candidatus Woesearchaeota archaeon]|nr:hypothetical protein [Candidatus Woesearchaeota archaeon]